LAEPAQDGGNKKAGEGAVSYRQLAHVGAVFYGVVQRTLAPQHRSEQIERHLARRGKIRHQRSLRRSPPEGFPMCYDANAVEVFAFPQTSRRTVKKPRRPYP